jgi:phosphatidylinositol glycan class M
MEKQWSKTSKTLFFGLAFLVRLVMLGIGSYIDEHTPSKKYTDTDYDVFSDAAEHVSNGGSPYDRHTYRYTPLAAYMALPNIWWFPQFAKWVFCVCDIIMGVAMWSLIES